MSQGKKSKYQKKLARKKGRATPDPRWMWWFERGEKVKAVA